MPPRARRPRDPVQLAKLIGDIATGQVQDVVEEPAKVLRARKGGLAWSTALTAEQRAEIARVAAQARWKKAKR
jgi:hypothetical protein